MGPRSKGGGWVAVYAVSDVHGCYTQFQHLLDKISLTGDDDLYILGDVIDRGPKSPEMLAWCLDAPPNVHVLLGNHEDMAGCVVRRDPEGLSMGWRDSWYCNGGDATRGALLRRTDPDWRRDRLAPWLAGLSPFARVEAGGRPFVLVHAGFDPRAWDPGAPPLWCGRLDDPLAHLAEVEVGCGLGVQSEQVMLWVRQGWLDYPLPAPVETVFGHTPTTHLGRGLLACGRPSATGRRTSCETGGIWHFRNRHDIDCGCVYGGRLAALRLDDMQEFYVRGKR